MSVNRHYSSVYLWSVILFAVLLGIISYIFHQLVILFVWLDTSSNIPIEWRVKRYIEFTACLILAGLMIIGGFRSWAFWRIATLVLLFIVMWYWWSTL